jgi:tRNA(His) 5'-end guanylyltransferase
MNGYSQALLTKDGLKPDVVQRTLNGINAGKLHEICFQHGVNLAATPAWERRGIMVYKKRVEKEGLNPLTGVTTRVFRNMVVEDRDLPLFSKPEGEELIQSLLRD